MAYPGKWDGYIPDPNPEIDSLSGDGDTTKKKEEEYKKTAKPLYNPKDRLGDPITDQQSQSPLQLKDPSNIQKEVKLDENGKDYIIEEKVGSMDYRPPTRMTAEQYVRYKNSKDRRDYFKEQSLEADKENAPENSAKRIIPQIMLPSSLDRVFGGNTVDIRPNGNVLLDFGGFYQKTANPNIPTTQQRSGGFLFNQQIAMNMQGKIGDKLKISINWDTKATFDFENNIKLTYTGYDHDIIKSIEAGVVSFPLNTTLIQGSQNLFGIKSQLQFGRLKVGMVLANQRSKTEEISSNPGASGGGVGQGKAFEIRADAYEENKHYLLAQFFRAHYDQWLASSPKITSGMVINRLEVYVTNRNNTTDKTRSIAAFADLGEYQPRNPVWTKPGVTIDAANNDANTLYERIGKDTTVGNAFRDPNAINMAFTDSMRKGIDFEVIKSARKLENGRDYKFHPTLGYLSLTTPLRNDDVLGIAFEYTYNGVKYQVGELTGDMPNDATKLAFMKLIRPSLVNVSLPMWNLQMKNVYSLNATNITRAGFQLRVIYKDDKSGSDNPFMPNLKDQKSATTQIMQLQGVDYLNSSLEPLPDGVYDFISSPHPVTIDSITGRIVFPVLEPFSFKDGLLLDSAKAKDPAGYNQYVFNELYTRTKSDLNNFSYKNKFFLKGSIVSNSSDEIALSGMNIAPGSIRVMAGSRQLVEGTDYTVNYDMGKVKIINPGILTSGNAISIKYEKADLFNFRTKSLMGVRLDYELSKDVNIGATMLRMTEKPLITRVGIGDEPINNTMLGADISLKKDSRLITKGIDKLPLIATKEPSSVQMSAEYATIIPGHSKYIGSTGNSFIDDFEGAENPFDLTRVPTRWKLATPPVSIADATKFSSTDLSYSYRRAKMAWYNIDNAFYREGSANRPASYDKAESENYATRAWMPQDLFPSKSVMAGQAYETTFDIAYFPRERGPYNYNPYLDSQGDLDSALYPPKKNFGGIMRAITLDTDFDNSNIQYVEFWLMDPFDNDVNGGIRLTKDKNNKIYNTTGGDMYFNFGSINEDVLNDGYQSFENGMPEDGRGDIDLVKNTGWASVAKKQYLNDAFSNTPGARANQDVGLDGLRSSSERDFAGYATFVNSVNASAVMSQEVKDRVLLDVSADDFQYYLGGNQDAIGATTIDRYKNFNGQEGNSPEVSGGGSYTPSSSTISDNEDLNQNNNIDVVDAYYEYKIELSPKTLSDKTANYLIGEQKVSGANGTDGTTWYQFRVPIRDIKATQVGGIDGFKSVRFMRMYLTNWEDPVVLRMAQFQLVAAQWRQYDSLITSKNLQITKEPNLSNMTVSTVNIEENSLGLKDVNSPYVLPPGFTRDQDYSSTLNRVFNEQSLRVCVDNLQDGVGRSVFKNFNINMVNFERLQMFIHAESQTITKDRDVYAMFRLGTDLVRNYYEVLIPLRMSSINSTDPNEVWPAENSLDVVLSDLSALKAGRRAIGGDQMAYYSENHGDQVYGVYGNPDFTSVQQIMIGVYNPKRGDVRLADGVTFPDDDGQTKTLCIWTDELRATGFNQKAGQAALGKMNVKLADLGTVTFSGLYKGIGFGSIEQKVSQREQNTTLQSGVSTQLQLQKFGLEKTGLKIPFYFSYDIQNITPKYDPSNPDVLLESAANSQSQYNSSDYKAIMVDRTNRRSINVTNLQKSRTKQGAKMHLWDIENLTFTAAYNDASRSNFLIDQYSRREYRYAIGYAFANPGKPFEPFKNISSKSKYMKPVTDFNLSVLPSAINVNYELLRSFTRTQLRNSQLSTSGVKPTFERSFFFNRRYGLRWSLARNLSLTYNAFMQSIIDEDTGEYEGFLSESISKKIIGLGRNKQFDQQVLLTYKLPFDKLPLTDFISTDISYGATYMWIASSRRVQDSLGNTIQNTRDIAANGKLDLLKLYNKSKFLKRINAPTPTSGKKAPPEMKMVLKKRADGTTDTLQVKKAELKVFKGILRAMMTMRSINANYSIMRGTTLPGYNKEAKFFGLDEAFSSPGLPFILGYQDPTYIKSGAVERGDLVHSKSFSDQFLQTKTVNLKANTALEPIKDLRIQLNITQTQTYRYQELFKDSTGFGDYKSYGPSRSGSYSVSTITLLTAFQKNEKFTNLNPAFNSFINNRAVVMERYKNANPNPGTYSLNSQDVLVTSFLAAYQGRDAGKIKLTSFPQIPLPNWRIDYGGLSKLKKIKEWFQSVNLTHGYNSLYTVRSFNSSLEYNQNHVDLNKSIFSNDMPNVVNPKTGQFIPVFVIGDVVIAESFSPLLGVNVKTKKNITFRVEYKRERALSLIMTNSSVNEQKNSGIVFGVGYIKTGMKLPVKSKGRTVVLKNEINMRCDVSVNDVVTIQRTIAATDETAGVSTITQGNQIIQVKPNVTYVISSRLNIQFYVDYTLNKPKVSTSFRRVNTQFGIQVRFTLS